MLILSATQQRLLEAPNDRVKMAIFVDDTTPYRYITGADPVQIGGEWFDPRPMQFSAIQLTAPRKTETPVTVDDMDGTLKTQFYTTRFKNVDATIWIFLQDVDGSWNEVAEVSWYVKRCAEARGKFVFHLSGAVGSRPRSGGNIGTRSEFPRAPEGGEPWKIGRSGGGGITGITFPPGIGDPPPLPGGQQMAYDPRGANAVVDGPAEGPTTDPSSGGQTTPGGTQAQAPGGTSNQTS